MDAEQVKEQVGQYLTQGGYYNANKQLYFMFTKVSGSAVLDTVASWLSFFFSLSQFEAGLVFSCHDFQIC